MRLTNQNKYLSYNLYKYLFEIINMIIKMKYLIYELFSGVGFCNQLFSFETAIYLANILNRKLILIIKYPLCHCGVSSWDYGNFLDFFNDNYKEFLPHGIEIYYRSIPVNILNIIKNKEKCLEIPFQNKFSHIVIVDKNLSNENEKIKNFCHNRKPFIMESYSEEYLYINKSNASRCFYNFYTTKENYELMSKICESLTHLNESFNLLDYSLDYNYISVHLRLGDKRHSKEHIDKNSINFYSSLTNQINKYKLNKKIVIMSDRKDGEIINQLKKKYEIIFTEDILKKIDKRQYFIHIKNHNVVDFLIQKQICVNSDIFIGYECSTVSHYIHYLNYLKYKDSNLYVNRTLNISDSYSWCNNGIFGAKIAFGLFFPDNIIRNNLKIITLTNDGYKELTDNLLYSMKLLGIEKELKIYCIGDECYNHYKSKYSLNEIEQINVDNDYLKKWLPYRSCQNQDIEGKQRWAMITSYKLYCMHNELLKGNDIVFIDGDIVFEKNPFYYLLKNIEDNELFVQNDFPTYEKELICSGFFYMKSNENTKKITNFSEVQKNINNFQNDQQYLRNNVNKLKIKYLPLELFPNGKFWRDSNPKNPYIIHFNYDVSEHKVSRMKQYNKWYLDKNYNPKVNIIQSNQIKKNEPLCELNQFIQKMNIKIRQGYMTQVKQHEESIYNYIKKYFDNNLNKILNVLEIGFLAGHSAEFFLKLNDNIKVTSIDVGAFQSVDCGKRYINLNYPNRHTLIKGDSKIKLKSINQNNKYDIIFIDGSYKYEDLKQDIANCKLFSKSNTLLIFNNVLKHKEYVKYWNKDPIIVWNESKDDKLVEEFEQIDIEVGRGTVLGKYL